MINMKQTHWCPFCKTKLITHKLNKNTFYCKCNDNTRYKGCYSWEHKTEGWYYWDTKKGYVVTSPLTNSPNMFIFR